MMNMVFKSEVNTRVVYNVFFSAIFDASYRVFEKFSEEDQLAHVLPDSLDIFMARTRNYHRLFDMNYFYQWLETPADALDIW